MLNAIVITAEGVQEPTFRDPQEAFERAIRAGRLSRDPADDNFAGNYMYMDSTPLGMEDCDEYPGVRVKYRDNFKSRDHRRYDV